VVGEFFSGLGDFFSALELKVFPGFFGPLWEKAYKIGGFRFLVLVKGAKIPPVAIRL